MTITENEMAPTSPVGATSEALTRDLNVAENDHFQATSPEDSVNHSLFLSPEHRAKCNAQAITDRTLSDQGVHSEMNPSGHGTGVYFPWRDGSTEVIQFRPDTPRGKRKYVWPAGQTTILNYARWTDTGPVLISEGQRQHLAVASWAPDEFSVVGMSGCDGIHSRTDLTRFAGRDIVLIFDADWTDLSKKVYEAAQRASRRLAKAGATSVRAVTVPTHLIQNANDGMDDFLSRVPEGDRSDFIAKLAADAATVPQAPRDAVRVESAAVSAEWLRDELGRGQLSCLFRRDDRIVHTPLIGEKGYIPPKRSVNQVSSPAQIQPVAMENIRGMIDSRYDVGIELEDKDTGEIKWVRKLFPRDSAQSAVSAAQIGEGAENLRPLRSVTHTPAVRADGSVLSVPGYDTGTCVMYLPDMDLEIGDVPERPTRDQVDAAVRYLLHPVKDFPFVSQDHRAAWLGLMFTPLLRELLPPPYQMGVFTATNRGSGKTMLAEMIGAVHGYAMNGPLPFDRDELRKRITADLETTTAPVIVADNQRGTVKSADLERLLTSDKYGDRLLGSTKSLSLTNDRLWLLTGNNVSIGGDLDRRIVTIKLDPRQGQNFRRTFEFDALKWIKENRSTYLLALLTVVRGWVSEGTPRGEAPTDYGVWKSGIRGLMAYAGVPGVFGKEVEMVTEEDSDWSEFLSQAFRATKGKPFEVRELSDLIGKSGGVPEHALPSEVMDRWTKRSPASLAGFSKSLGRFLSNRNGTYADGWVCRSEEGDGKKAKRWVISAPEGEEPAAAPVEAAQSNRSNDPWAD